MSQMTGRQVDLCIDSDAALVAGVQSRLLELGRDAGLDELAAFQLTVAVVEAVNNCIEHAYQGEPGHEVALRWTLTQTEVVVEIRDTGEPIPEERLDSSGPGRVDSLSGRGWHIIREWTDQAAYASNEGVNTLTLRLHRQPKR